MGPMQEKYVLSIMSYQDIQYQAISYYQNNFTILGLARDMTIEGFPGPRRCPQLVPWAAEERVPELATHLILKNQITCLIHRRG